MSMPHHRRPRVTVAAVGGAETEEQQQRMVVAVVDQETRSTLARLDLPWPKVVTEVTVVVVLASAVPRMSGLVKPRVGVALPRVNLRSIRASK